MITNNGINQLLVAQEQSAHEIQNLYKTWQSYRKESDLSIQALLKERELPKQQQIALISQLGEQLSVNTLEQLALKEKIALQKQQKAELLKKQENALNIKAEIDKIRREIANFPAVSTEQQCYAHYAKLLEYLTNIAQIKDCYSPSSIAISSSESLLLKKERTLSKMQTFITTFRPILQELASNVSPRDDRIQEKELFLLAPSENIFATYALFQASLNSYTISEKQNVFDQTLLPPINSKKLEKAKILVKAEACPTIDPFSIEFSSFNLPFSALNERDKEIQQIKSLTLAAQIEQQELMETLQAFEGWKNAQEQLRHQLTEENAYLKKQVAAIQQAQETEEKEHILTKQALEKSSAEIAAQIEDSRKEIKDLEIYFTIGTTTQVVLAKGEPGATTEFPHHLIQILDRDSMDESLPPNCSADYLRMFDSHRPGLRGDVSTKEKKIAKIQHLQTMSYAPIKCCVIC